MENSKRNIILITGITGMTAAFISSVGDVVLLASPVSGWELYVHPFGHISEISWCQCRIIVGGFLGVVFLPLMIVGLYHILYGLKPLGKCISWFTFIIAAHAVVVGTIFHASHMFMITGVETNFAIIGTSEAGISEMIALFTEYIDTMFYLLIVESLIASLLFVIAVLTGRTLFPRPMAIANPVILIVAVTFVFILLPAPIGGYLGASGMNVGMFIFFFLSTLVLSRRRRIVSQGGVS